MTADWRSLYLVVTVSCRVWPASTCCRVCRSAPWVLVQCTRVEGHTFPPLAPKTILLPIRWRPDLTPINRKKS